MKNCSICGRFKGKNHKCGFNTHLINTPESKEKAQQTIKKKYYDKGIFFGYKCGENHLGWSGDNVGYMGVHSYIRKIKKKPLNCEECGKKRKLELANISGEYKRSVKDFKYICRSCHQKMDRTKQNFQEEKIKSISVESCEEDFYDIETETHNFIANGIVTHNSRPSKKSISSGFYMPSILRESIEVVVSVDTSGSISREELSEFLGEIINIARSFNNIKIKLIVCDCEIKEVYDFSNGDIDEIMNLKFSGGGGTSHKPVYEYLAENLPSTKLIVNLTDGFTDFPDEETFKTIWVLTKNGCDESKIPFGEVIKWE